MTRGSLTWIPLNGKAGKKNLKAALPDVVLEPMKQTVLIEFGDDEPVTPEPRSVELHAACLNCEARAHCETHDPKAGCVTVALEKQPAPKKPRTPKKSKKPVEEKQAAAQDPHCCDTCIGGYSNSEAITMDCPDYPDVSNGTIDQEQLRATTRRLGCTFWAAPGTPPKIPNWAWCVGTRSCKSLSSVDGICTKTGQKLKEMTYCPTQHLIGEQPEPKKKSASKKSKKPQEETQS